MMIYYNANFQLYLENQAASNYNRPAEYRLVAEFADGFASLAITAVKKLARINGKVVIKSAAAPSCPGRLH